MENHSDVLFDLVIVGGGPAGYVAAVKAKVLGFNVALVEQERLGGACINRGCIPTKALWGSAYDIKKVRRYVPSFSLSYEDAVARQFKIVDQIVGQIDQRLRRLGVITIKDRVQRISKVRQSSQSFTIEGLNQSLKAKRVLLATGSSPFETPVLKADHQRIITTDDLVLQKDLPKRIAIAGGGVIACEFGSMLANFGSEVHIFEHSNQILSSMDSEIISLLMDELRHDGVQLHLNSRIHEIVTNPSGSLRIYNQDHSDIEVDQVLLAIGRRPNIDIQGLKELQVEFQDKGFISVNNKLETHCRNLYAAGDLVGGPMLAHKAWHEADVAVRSMAGEEVSTNYNIVPGAIFTIPEMASVGITYEQAQNQNISVDVGKFSYNENSHALCIDEPTGLVKVVSEKSTGRLLGCTIFGYGASSLISEFSVAMSKGLTAQDLGNAIHPHPTLSEMIWEACLGTQGRSIHH